MTLELRPFQGEDLNKVWADYLGRALVAWDMGLGKGVFSIAAVRDFVVGPTVVVCPAGLREHWRREFDVHLGRRVEVLTGMSPRAYSLPKGPRVWVVGWDTLRVPSAKRRTWVELLRGLEPDLIVGDEIHYAKNPGAKRSRAFRELCRDVPHVLGLSGTPVEAKPIELWNILSIIRPNLFPSRKLFGLRYCAGRNMPWGWDFNGASHLDELNGILTGPNGCMVRRRKEDVLDQLPPLTKTVIPFELSPAQQRDYNYAVHQFLAWLAERDEDRARRALFAERMARVGYLKRLAAEYKLPAVIAWVRDFLEGSDRKLMVFGIHKFVLHGLHDQFRHQSVLVTGETPAGIRQSAYDRFNRDRNCRLLFGNILAAGVGWSCTSASDVAFAELDWKPAPHGQAVDRCRGIARGTGMPVNASFLVAARTIEEDLCDILEKRQGVLDAILDGGDLTQDKLFGLLEAAIVARGGGRPTRRRVRSQ